ncbi:popeye domain-containing protein 3 [Caerostris extrusa]|uniref:Popeye domain-containing protein 3 n=1 Tax=Caerostris extrusa TaxID=172846 RepID=A0AAV4Y7R1_CAEEX|nr:popeye domain-containing protein 3 [Caerostris extrusa]
MRKVKLPLELEDIYRILFQPLQVSRLSFQKLRAPECAQMLNLHPGEAYAMQGLTRTDRLGLLIKGKANVISGQHFLHQIQANEFLDSPEFESSFYYCYNAMSRGGVAETEPRIFIDQRDPPVQYPGIAPVHGHHQEAVLNERQDGDRERFPLGYPASKFHRIHRFPRRGKESHRIRLNSRFILGLLTLIRSSGRTKYFSNDSKTPSRSI